MFSPSYVSLFALLVVITIAVVLATSPESFASTATRYTSDVYFDEDAGVVFGPSKEFAVRETHNDLEVGGSGTLTLSATKSAKLQSTASDVVLDSAKALTMSAVTDVTLDTWGKYDVTVDKGVTLTTRNDKSSALSLNAAQGGLTVTTGSGGETHNAEGPFLMSTTKGNATLKTMSGAVAITSANLNNCTTITNGLKVIPRTTTTITSDTTLYASDSGGVFWLDGDSSGAATQDFTVSLPPAEQGLVYFFTMKPDNDYNIHVVTNSAASNHFYGTITLNDDSTTALNRNTQPVNAQDQITFVATKTVAGDSLEVRGIDTGFWHVKAISSAPATANARATSIIASDR